MDADVVEMKVQLARVLERLEAVNRSSQNRTRSWSDKDNASLNSFPQTKGRKCLDADYRGRFYWCNHQ